VLFSPYTPPLFSLARRAFHRNGTMSLSSFLQSPDLIASLSRNGIKELRAWIFARGGEWFDTHPEESHSIQKNLTAFGILHNPEFIHRVQTHILLHYYEKMLPLCLSPQEYHRYLMERVKLPPQFAEFKSSLEQKNGALLAVCHFGAVECIGPALLAHGVPLTGVMRFSTQHLAAAVRERSAQLAATGLFSPMNFVEIGATQSPAALDMAAVLRRGETLLGVFDEKTNYSVPVTLFNKQVLGGAGLDRLVKFARPNAAVYTAFATRNDNETYDMHLYKLSGNDQKLVQAMYGALQPFIAEQCDQWYFLHEEIPFVI
jgi:lauroyl/myristoyl acyltransferase